MAEGNLSVKNKFYIAKLCQNMISTFERLNLNGFLNGLIWTVKLQEYNFSSKELKLDCEIVSEYNFSFKILFTLYD